MTLVRWNPTPMSLSRELAGLHDEMNRLMEGLLPRNGSRLDWAPGFVPAVDVEESPEEFVVRTDLPGVQPRDVKVTVIGDTLTLRGERKQERVDEKSNLHRSERICGAFERSFALGAPVRADKVKAIYRDGVLEVRVPKAEEARQREIQVEVG